MRRRDILLLGIAVVVAMGSPAVGTPATSAAAYHGLPAAPDPGSTLHVLSDLGAIDLDPSAANTRTTRSMLSGLVVRSLTQLGYDPDRRQTVLEPDLATTL